MFVLHKELKGKKKPKLIDLHNKTDYLNFTSTKTPNPEQYGTK